MKPPERSDDSWATRARAEMVREQLEGRGIRDPRVLDAMSRVPRHEFVPPSLRKEAYLDRPLPIGGGQTISQPYIVALMTELLELQGGEMVLDVGTGCGYQAAVLAELGARVVSIEIHMELAARAAERLHRLGYEDILVEMADGKLGWPSGAPYDGIVVAAAPDRVPKALLDQLAFGGRLIIPVGSGEQTLKRIVRTKEGFDERTVTKVAFVPLV
ncbi:MAG: protein-L-isoaspartate(D-aspartate) O-methyltransferase [Planctomycetota bacterium]